MSILGEPYGGTLVNLLVTGDEREELGRRVSELPTIELDSRTISDFELLANGGFSPLTGFMAEADYHSVVDSMTLSSGLPWSIPVTLSVSESRAGELTPGVSACLRDEQGLPLGVIEIQDVYRRDKTLEAEKVFRTTDEAHPGVAALYSSGDIVLGGAVQAIRLPAHNNFPAHRLTPMETRASFAERGWRTVVGFQTRNPIHRAHEYLIKVALEGVDGALIHPLVGDTKDDDIPADVRMRCYQVLMDRYFPEDRVELSVLPAAMRYAGPREAIFHAIMRKNYGCTHFIVGRDHAGVGNYYGTYDAQRIFDDIDLEALGIQPLFFEHAFWCLRSGAMATTKTSAAEPEERLFLSGTKVREMLANGEDLPVEFTRPEVAAVLMESARSA
ncbi:MAG: sulfate adenylyltransferase [Dehalococcoidia bacterium]|nr:sulfate adenylyltransferase [Dehalococcoidia bacterium]HCU99787.1 sulfate adenylyltransferase [Dehalococcoidia bacterium]|tara:strand:- start:6811 stop:7971 length:1161 start_codon:yes stop_codon:yes gene_type:complete